MYVHVAWLGDTNFAMLRHRICKTWTTERRRVKKVRETREAVLKQQRLEAKKRAKEDELQAKEQEYQLDIQQLKDNVEACFAQAPDPSDPSLRLIQRTWERRQADLLSITTAAAYFAAFPYMSSWRMVCSPVFR